MCRGYSPPEGFVPTMDNPLLNPEAGKGPWGFGGSPGQLGVSAGYRGVTGGISRGPCRNFKGSWQDFGMSGGHWDISGRDFGVHGDHWEVSGDILRGPLGGFWVLWGSLNGFWGL